MELQEEKKVTGFTHFDDIYTNVSWAEIARSYFGKSSSWLYNKLKGIDGNGGIGGFTEKEKEILKEALLDLSDRIRYVAETY